MNFFKKIKRRKKSLSRVLRFGHFEKCINDIKNMSVTKNKQALEIKIKEFCKKY